MAKAKTHTLAFKWGDHNLSELKREYYEIGVTAFLKKYKTGTQSLYRHLGRIPEDQKPLIKRDNGKLRKKMERLENTTKVARMYEKKMQELESPKYVGPWSQFIKS